MRLPRSRIPLVPCSGHIVPPAGCVCNANPARLVISRSSFISRFSIALASSSSSAMSRVFSGSAAFGIIQSARSSDARGRDSTSNDQGHAIQLRLGGNDHGATPLWLRQVGSHGRGRQREPGGDARDVAADRKAARAARAKALQAVRLGQSAHERQPRGTDTGHRRDRVPQSAWPSACSRRPLGPLLGLRAWRGHR